MGTTDKQKNREYVARHRAKKREQMGDVAYKTQHAEAIQTQRDKKREADEEEFKKKNREYMAEYRRKKREAEEVKKKIEATNKTKSMIDDIFGKVLGEIPIKRKAGRPKLLKEKTNKNK